MTMYMVQAVKGGRVVLSDEKIFNSEILRHIEADSWVEARAHIDWMEYKKVDGYGYYID